MQYEHTSLWKRGLGAQRNDTDSAARERLRAAYALFWDNALALLSQIGADLPNLTLHDRAHVEALWERADQIAGDNYPMTALEVFAFGGAILLHDAGLAIAAYPGRLSEIEATGEWRDTVAALLMTPGGEPITDEQIDNAPQDIRRQALFVALRTLHARRAEDLGSLSYRTKAGITAHLIPDDELRTHISPTMGLVAASHHWDMDELEKRLPRRVGPGRGMPAQWHIEPIKLACLLRCADAIQIDQARAPDFMYALLQLHGLSEEHWRAQNYLATPVIDARDHEALIFSSTRPFKESDANAWWIAHDAIRVANRELQASHVLLKDLQLLPFAIRRIRDAESPDRLSKHVRTEGWRPVSAEVRVGRVSHVITMFAGPQLYGHDVSVPLRELIQNGDDAIRARRVLDDQNSSYSGKITVRLEPGKDGDRQGYWLQVEDDGFGMTEADLVGPLLEFGTSYWSSDLVRQERPGLESRIRGQTGRYGIGFFSVFMLTDRVLVTSRPFDAGLDACRTLSFRKGSELRPLLLDQRGPNFGAMLSTRVSLFLTNERVKELLSFRTSKSPPWHVTSITLAQLIGHLCPCPDSDVHVQDGASSTCVHSRTWFDGDPQSWLRRITIADALHNDYVDGFIATSAPLLRPVSAVNSSAGRAAISFRSEGLMKSIGIGLDSIGGLVSGRHARNVNSFDDKYVGSMGFKPDGPRRGSGRPVATDVELASWASVQARLLAGIGLSTREFQRAALIVAHYGGDPTPIANCLINRAFASLEEVFGRLKKGTQIRVPVEASSHENGVIVLGQLMIPVRGGRMALSAAEIELRTDVLEAPSFSGIGINDAFYRIPTDADPAGNSLLGCLHRFAGERGYEIDIALESETVLASYIGKSSEREGITSGSELKVPCVCLTAKKPSKT